MGGLFTGGRDNLFTFDWSMIAVGLMESVCAVLLTLVGALLRLSTKLLKTHLMTSLSIDSGLISDLIKLM